jgi:hypothetical protein
MNTQEPAFAHEDELEVCTVIRNMQEPHGDWELMISDWQNVWHKVRGNMPPDDVKGTQGH